MCGLLHFVHFCSTFVIDVYGIKYVWVAVPIAATMPQSQHIPTGILGLAFITDSQLLDSAPLLCAGFDTCCQTEK